MRSGELRRNGTTVRLQPQPLKVLLLLAGRPGEVVTREEIQAEIWPAGTFVDFEQSLNFCIRQIRAALRDDANAPRYVETLPRRGYRWVAGPVQSETRPPWCASGRARSPPMPSRASVEASSGAVTAALPAAPAVPGHRGSCPLALAILRRPGCSWRSRSGGRSRKKRRPRRVFHRITFRRGALNSARFAPDGLVVYSAAWDGGPRELQVTRSDGRDSRALDIKDAQVVGVSSSGEVAFLQRGVLARAPLAGGPAKEMLKEVGAADWTADGRDFAVTRWEARQDQARVPGRARAHGDSGQGEAGSGSRLTGATSPTPSTRCCGDDRGLVVVVDRSGRRVATSQEWASLEGLAWAPGGREVYFTAAESGADSSLRGLSLDGKVRLVLSGTGRFVLHDTAPDGRILLERATLRSEIQLHKGGSGEDRDLSWLDFSAVEGISPNGDTVLFFESGEGGGPEYTSFLRKTDGSPPVRLGSGRALDLSPDGRFVISVDIQQPERARPHAHRAGRDPAHPRPGPRRARGRGLPGRQHAHLRDRARRVRQPGHLAHRRAGAGPAAAAAAGGPHPPVQHLLRGRLALRGLVPRGAATAAASTTRSRASRSPCRARRRTGSRSASTSAGPPLLPRPRDGQAGVAAAARAVDRSRDDARRARPARSCRRLQRAGREHRRRRRGLGLHVPTAPLRPAHRQRREVALVQRIRRRIQRIGHASSGL